MSIIDRAHLLAREVPYICRQSDLTLNAGTAIKILNRNVPRYSVDIDLIFLPSGSYIEHLRSIHEKLEMIAKDIRTKRIPRSLIVGPGPASRESSEIYFRRSFHRIQVDVSPVWNDAIWLFGLGEVTA